MMIFYTKINDDIWYEKLKLMINIVERVRSMKFLKD